ncbi:MAG: hypothetical protein ACAH59_00765 [Pseudobdellovibrionaceae bacterium]
MSDVLRASGLILETPLEASIVQSLERVASLIRGRGYPCQASSKPALVRLPMLSSEQKHQVLHQLQVLEQIIFAKEPEAPPVEKGEHSEKNIVEQALDFYNLEIRDDFWSRVKSNEVIEIYNQNQIQIFRTLNFFNYCGYSLLDLLTNEWYTLWQRPSTILEALKTKAEEVFSGVTSGAQALNLSNHLVLEIFNSEKDEFFLPRSMLIEFGILCPLYRRDLPIVQGALITSSVSNLTIGKETNRMAVL